jgi:hypothetical protein
VPNRPAAIPQILTLLAETPRRMTGLTAGLSPELLRTAPDSLKGVSLRRAVADEVLAHLRTCADVWGNCIAAMLTEETPTLRAVNPRTWIKQTNYLDLDFPASLGSFTAQRADLLAVLDPLPPDGWSRKATVTGAGKVLERTVLDYAERLARLMAFPVT